MQGCTLHVSHGWSFNAGGMMDQSEAARAWAKIQAYIRCGHPEKVEPWARMLIEWWESEGVPIEKEI